MTKQAITAVAFIHKNGKLFAPRRAATKSFLPNEFELPGGHIEYGEDLIAGLERELDEEFGLKVMIGDPFFAFTYINEAKQAHYVEIVYFAKLQNPNEDIRLNPDDHSESRWVNEKEALELWVEGDSERQAILEGFRFLRNSEVTNTGATY